MRTASCCLLILGILAIVGSSTAVFGLVPHAETEALEIPLAYDLARMTFPSQQGDENLLSGTELGNGWVVRPNGLTGTAHFAYGGDAILANEVKTEAEAIDLARTFLRENSEVTGVRAGNHELQHVKFYRAKYAVHFRQVVAGIHVRTASAFVVVGESGRVMAFGSDFVPAGSVDTVPNLGETDAIRIATSALGATARADRPVTAEQLLLPVLASGVAELTLAYRVTFESEEPFGKWVTFVSGTSGTILGRSNEIHFVDVVGNVEADVEDFGYCDGAGIQPLDKMTVNVVGGNSADTDAAGDFVVPNAGSADVDVTAGFVGPFISVDWVWGDESVFAGTATPGVPLQITWDQSNSRRDERNTFLHGNRVHDFMKTIDPAFIGLDYTMPVTVGNLFGICPGNAWWDGVGMNYCAPGEGFANTGRIGNVIYHEYGHGVTQEWYIQNGSDISGGDMHEGNADVLANFLDRNPIIGFGFFLGNCSSGIRNADNNLQWPDDNNGGHFGGQIIAGFHWDAWQSLLGAMPPAQADPIAWDTWHFGRGMGIPQNQADQVLWTFIADDDDADLSNGSPNYSHFCLAAQNHGFECPTSNPPTDVTLLGDPGAALFDLAHNQPNPWATATRIEFSLGSRAETDLSVYNVRGQRVRNLVTGIQGEGAHVVRWDGRDEVGDRVAPGVFFYRLTVGDESVTRKMTMMY